MDIIEKNKQNEIARSGPRRAFHRLSSGLGVALLAAVSVLAAFFGVFNALFSDIFSIRDRLETFAYIGAGYLFFGFAAGFLGPSAVKRRVAILAAPALAILLLFTLLGPRSIFLHAGYAAVVFFAASAGVRLGSRARSGNKRARRMKEA